MSEQETVHHDYDGLPPGTMIKGYRIERELGRGAMAVVYLATQIDLGRQVALKVLGDELAHDRDFVKRFFNEAQAAAALNHPNIIKALDAGVTEDGIHYFCMEYVDGKTLLDLIKRKGRIELEQCRKWFLEIAQALNYGWELHKFTHGDLKPENIMINGEGHAKLADFGLAKVDGHDYSGNVVMLTPLYAPPEMIRGERFVDECRPDIYAFGASLYHALAGTPPFPGTDAQVVIKRQLHEPLEPLSHRNLLVPLEWSEFVGKMLVKDMAGRMDSWEAVINGLTSLGGPRKSLVVRKEDLAMVGSSAARESRKARKGVPLIWSMVVVLLLVLVLLFGVLVLKGRGGGRVPASPSPSRRVARVQKARPPVQTAAEPASQAAVKQAERAVPRKASPKTVPVPPEKPSPAPVPVKLGPEPKRQIEEILSDDVKVLETAGARQKQAKKKPAKKRARRYPGNINPHNFDIPIALKPAQREFLDEMELALNWCDISKLGSLPSIGMDQRNQFAALAANKKRSPQVRKMADFILNTVVANYDRLPEVITADINLVRNHSFELGRDRVRVVNCVKHGRVISPVLELKSSSLRTERKASWAGLHRTGLLFGLCRQMILKHPRGWGQSRSYLAYCALSGRNNVLDPLLKVFPVDKEKDLWRKLEKLGRFRTSENEERVALELFQKLEDHAEAGSWVGVNSLCRKLRDYGNTKVFEQCKELLATLEAKCPRSNYRNLSFQVLMEQVDTMQSRGSAEDKDGLDAALALMCWQAWHGESTVRNEERKFERSFLNVVSMLEQNQETDALAKVVGFLFDSAEDPVQRVSGRARAFCRKEVFPKKLQDQQREIEDLLRLSARLELGDWRYSSRSNQRSEWRQLENRGTLRKLGADGELLYALSCYGRSLLWLRYHDNYSSCDRHVSHLLGLPEHDSEYLPAIYGLCLESWLLGRRGSKARNQDLMESLCKPAMLEKVAASSKHDDSQTCNARIRRRVFYMYVANLLESGRLEVAQDLLKQVLKDENGELKVFGFENEQLACLKKLAGYVQGNFARPVVEEKALDVPAAPEYLRALLSGLKERMLTEKQAGAFKDILEKGTKGWRLLGGDVTFDLILRRVAYELSIGRYDRALKQVHWGLERKGSCLFPYHFRLLCLRAGILQLVGIRAGACDAAVLAQESTVMSKREQQICEAIQSEAGLRTVSLGQEASHHTYFWYHWLMLCDRVGRNQDSIRVSMMDELQLYAGYVQGAERSLLRGLRQTLAARSRKNGKGAAGKSPK